MAGITLRELVAALTITVALAEVAAADEFPQRPIRMIVPSAAGGGGDLVGRLLAEGLARRLKVPVVVENNSGASGTIAMGQLARSRPDGYTIGLGTMTSTLLAPAVFEKLAYDPVKDLAPVASIGTSPIMMVAASDFPANDIPSFLKLSREAAAPLQYATWGIGSTGHFCAAVLAQKTRIELTHVPYKSTAPIVTALLGGEVRVAWLDMATATAALKSGRIKPLAMCTRRAQSHPDVRTYREQGVDFDQWTGWSVLAPAGVDPSALHRIEAALKDTVADPAIASRLGDWGITPAYVAADEQSRVNREAVGVWKQIAEAAGMKQQ